MPFLNVLDTHLSNTANADVIISVNFMTFEGFFLNYLVSKVVKLLTLTPTRDTVANGMLNGRLINVLNVATLDIPVAMVIPLAQACSHISRFNILVYFLDFLLYRSSSFNNPCHLD